MGCGASAPAGSRAAKKAGHVNPTTAMKEIHREFEGTDVWGFEKSNTSRESTIEGSDGLWSLNERALAQKHSFEWLQKRKKVEQFMLSMQGYGVPFLTVVACIQLFQEGAGWPHHTPALTESLFVKCVFVTALPSFIAALNCLLHPFRHICGSSKVSFWFRKIYQSCNLNHDESVSVLEFLRCITHLCLLLHTCFLP